MSKIIVTYDKSNEDIPTLVVGREEGPSLFGSSTIRIDKIITGQKAEDIWEELTGEKARKKAVEEMLKKYDDSLFKPESDSCDEAAKN